MYLQYRHLRSIYNKWATEMARVKVSEKERIKGVLAPLFTISVADAVEASRRLHLSGCTHIYSVFQKIPTTQNISYFQNG